MIPRPVWAELTNGDSPTVIFDCTGNPKAMMDGFLLLAHTGRYVLVSLVTADITFPDPEFHKRETTLLSSRNANKEDFEWVMECMEAGKVNVGADGDPSLSNSTKPWISSPAGPSRKPVWSKQLSRSEQKRGATLAVAPLLFSHP